MLKKNILLASLIVAVGIIILESVGTYTACDWFISNAHEGNCPFLLADIETILLPFLPLFLFSLITYKMKDHVFQAWFRFVRISIPISIVVILLAPSYSSSWILPYNKGMAALLCSAFFILVSTVKIIAAHRQMK